MSNPIPKRSRPPITVLEPMRANNTTSEEETWPIAEFGSYGGVTEVAEMSDLSRLIAERIAAAPVEKRAELVAQVNAEIARALAAAPPAA